MIQQPGSQSAPEERPPPSGTEPPAPLNGEAPALRIQRGFERMLTLSRLLVLIPVIFLLLDAAGSFVYGSDILVRSATGLISEPAKVGGRLGLFLIVMDTFLVGATLLIAAFGFYELFVIKGERTGRAYWLPGWLQMHDLEDLKARVVSMLILVAAITFVDRTVEAHDKQEILFLGIGISIIIAALTAFLWFGKRRPPAGGAAAGGAAAAGAGATPAADPPVAAPADLPAARSGPPPAAHAGRTAGSADPGDHPGSTPNTAAQLAGPPTSAVRPALAFDAARGSAVTRPRPADRSSRRRARVVALFGSSRGGGGWNASGRTDVIAFAGWARIDLTDADLRGDLPQIRVISVFGLVSIAVPPEMAVADSGLALLGSRSVRSWTAGPGPAGTPGAPGLVLSGACILGAMRVRRKP